MKAEDLSVRRKGGKKKSGWVFVTFVQQGPGSPLLGQLYEGQHNSLCFKAVVLSHKRAGGLCLGLQKR